MSPSFTLGGHRIQTRGRSNATTTEPDFWPKVTLPGSPYASLSSYNGRLVYEFQQGNTDSYGFINLDPQTREGACYALSGLWLIAKRNGTDFVEKVNKPSGIKAMNNTQVAMGMFKKKGGSSVTFLKNWMTAEGFNCDPSTDVSEADWPTSTAAASAVGTPGYNHINLQFNKGGHAVASLVTTSDFRFFDPNWGEARFFAADKMVSWFVNELLPHYDRSFGMSWYRIVTLKKTI